MPMPKKPDPLHWLEGTKSQAKEVLENRDGFTVPESRPRTPKDLNPEALAIFKRLCGLLKKRHALTAGDVELLRLYAITSVRHSRAIAKLEEEGEVCVYSRLDSNGAEVKVEKPNLWLKIAESSERTMVACLDRLGLSPLNRSKVRPAAEAKPAAPVPLEKTPEQIEEETMERLLQTSKRAPFVEIAQA
jgi:P27 family predicted phage terminase small subunit